MIKFSDWKHRAAFELSGVTALTTVAATVWMVTPDEWHPVIPQVGKYVIMGIATALAVAAHLVHWNMGTASGGSDHA